MSDINTVTLQGRLTRDPEIVASGDDWQIVTFGLAVSDSKKVGDEWVEEPSFFDVKVSGGISKLVANKARKGDLVTVAGRLKQERWETPEGENRSKVVVAAKDVGGEFRFRKADDVPAAAAPAQAAPAAAPAQDDDIPF